MDAATALWRELAYSPGVSELQALSSILRQSADANAAAAIETLVRDAPDAELNRVNALAFAAKTGLDEERVIAAFLHAARIGLFEMSWNVLCPGCGGVIEANTTLKSVHKDEYFCGRARPATRRRSTN